METNFNFKSQPCTSIEQSERLLALGLKKETADMRYYAFYLSSVDAWYIKEYPEVLYDGEQIKKHDIPAWSLHRLLAMLTTKRKVMLIRFEADLYDVLIDKIEHEIKEGYFNKEYLV